MERNFDIEAELLQEGLCWGLGLEAFPWGEVVHEEDVSEVLVGEFVAANFSGHVAATSGARRLRACAKKFEAASIAEGFLKTDRQVRQCAE